MNTFLTLNRYKVKFGFIITALTCLSLVSTFLIVAYCTGNFPGWRLLFAIVVVAGIVFPLFIILLAYLGWQYNHNTRRKVFSQLPFDQLESIGFYKSYYNLNTRWFFTEEIKEGKINGFTLAVDINRERRHIIDVTIETAWKHLDKAEYKRLEEKFKEYNIEFLIGALVKHYDARQPGFISIHELKNDLQYFTLLLQQEGFEPANHYVL